jgi:hypothetical protein
MPTGPPSEYLDWVDCRLLQTAANRYMIDFFGPGDHAVEAIGTDSGRDVNG